MLFLVFAVAKSAAELDQRRYLESAHDTPSSCLLLYATLQPGDERGLKGSTPQLTCGSHDAKVHRTFKLLSPKGLSYRVELLSTRNHTLSDSNIDTNPYVAVILQLMLHLV